MKYLTGPRATASFSAVTRPGGMCGPSAKTTRITPTMLATAQMTAIRRRWSRPGSEVEVAAI
jgi:hypothetical protein